MSARTLARLRALGRLAWRDARLHRARSALIVAMIALPVTALTVGLVFLNGYSPTTAQRSADVLGHADVTIVGDDPAALARVAAEAPPGSVTTVRTTVTAAAIVDGRQHTVVVDDVLPDDRTLAPRYEMVDGRVPRLDGETVVAPSVLDDFGLDVGDEIVFEQPEELRLRITGTVIRSERLTESFALVPPGTLDGTAGADVSGVFIDLPRGAGAGDLRVGDDLDAVTRADMENDADDRPAAFGGMFGLAALGLAETGMVIAAAFVVGVQRRLRRIGMVAAIGGEPRHTGLMVLFEGVVLGLVGATAGAVLGVLITRLLATQFDRVAGRVIGRVPLPLGLLAGAVALGIVAATLAVLGQARLARRVDIVDALASRLPAPAPPGRVARRGLVVALAGGAIIAVGTDVANESIQVLGVGVMAAGMLMMVPLLVAATGRLGSRLPLPLRLAARDTARHGRRATAAVAGAALALALPVTMATLTLGLDAQSRAAPPLATDHLLVSASSRSAMADAPVIDRAIRSVVDVDAMAPLEIATFTGADGGAAEVFAGPTSPTVGDQSLGRLTVGGSDLLRALNAEERIADLRAGRIVAIGDDALDTDTVHVGSAAGDHAPVTVRAVESDGPRYEALTTFVMSPERAAQLGLEAASPGPRLYRASAPVTTTELERIRSAIAAIDGVWILAAEDTFVDSATTQSLPLAVAIPVALATLAVSTAMVVAESRRDQAVLAAVGAAPGIRRRTVASAAFLLGLLAAAIAIPAGFVPIALMFVLSEPAYPLVVPWVSIATVLGAAGLAGLGGLVLTRTPSGQAMLRPLS